MEENIQVTNQDFKKRRSGGNQFQEKSSILKNLVRKMELSYRAYKYLFIPYIFKINSVKPLDTRHIK